MKYNRMRGLLLALAGIILVSLFSACEEKKEAATAPPEVPFTKVKVQDVPVYQEYVGQTLGQADIDIQARVEGEVTGIHFKEGSTVKKGQLLYTIDPMEYDAKVAQGRAQLAEAESLMANAESDLKRIRPLAAMNAVSQRELDACVAKEGAARSRVDAALAVLSNQKLERSYCNIVAPIDGIIGISKVKVGDIAGSGITRSVLNTISSTSTMRVRFSVSESNYLKFREELKNSATPIDPNNMETELFLVDGSIFPQKGKLNFSDRGVDPSTGTMTIEASFPNPEGSLRPGQFVRIRFITGVLKNAMLIPQRAVREMQGIFQVFVINKENTLTMKAVEPGIKIKGDWVVKNLDAADRVALLGTQFIRAGSPVKPVAAGEATDKPIAN
jgi:membrane fusion protein (multidrug efflux system)